MSVQLLTEHHLEFLSFKGGCTGSSESSFVKMPHCWKSRVAAQIINQQQQQDHRLRTDSSLSHGGGGGGEGLNAIYWYQIFALDSGVVKTQKLFSSHGGGGSSRRQPTGTNQPIKALHQGRHLV